MLKNRSVRRLPQHETATATATALMQDGAASTFPYTLVHGDLRRITSFFLSTPRTRSLLIGNLGMGQPMTDIARWLTQSITIETRRSHEQELLTIYHDRLVERGVTQYTKKQMISDYELNLVVTLLMFSMSMDEIDQSSDRAAVLFDAMYSRLEAALEIGTLKKY